MLAGVSSVLLVLGPLVGVVVGALLPEVTRRRALVRERYETAMADIAHLTAASNIVKTAYVDGVPDEQASERLRQRMLDVQQDALLQVRRSLALLSVHSEQASVLLADVPALHGGERPPRDRGSPCRDAGHRPSAPSLRTVTPSC
jgi:hypothetical protein